MCRPGRAPGRTATARASPTRTASRVWPTASRARARGPRSARKSRKRRARRSCGRISRTGGWSTRGAAPSSPGTLAHPRRSPFAGGAWISSGSLDERADGAERAGALPEALPAAGELEGQNLHLPGEEKVLPGVEASGVASSLRETKQAELGADDGGAQARGGGAADERLGGVDLYHGGARARASL